METQDRDDSGHFSEKMTEQDLLKAFDFEASVEEPYLTVKEVAEALAVHWDINVTDEAVRTRLERMCEDETVAKRDFGSSVAYRALVAPELSDEVKTSVEETKGEYETGETVPLDELDI